METSQSLLSTFHLQLDLISFFDLFHADRVEQALDVMRELQLLPVTNEQVIQFSKILIWSLRFPGAAQAGRRRSPISFDQHLMIDPLGRCCGVHFCEW